MSLRLPAASTLRLAQIFMSEPAACEAELTPDHREAAVELLRQVAGLVATSLKASWGEVQLRLEPSAGAPSWPASSTAWLRAGSDPRLRAPWRCISARRWWPRCARRNRKQRRSRQHQLSLAPAPSALAGRSASSWTC